ncbi:MAG: hypothetical protein J6X35_00175, partial [Bacteroidales bacterium]|nr:hypothetical protein [Bacteroidales bacterium]
KNSAAITRRIVTTITGVSVGSARKRYRVKTKDEPQSADVSNRQRYTQKALCLCGICYSLV